MSEISQCGFLEEVTSGFDPRRFHPRFRVRNFAVRAVEKQLGTRLTDEQVMWLFNCTLNVARQTRSPLAAAIEDEGW